MDKDLKVIYICSGDVSVYEAQVLELLTYLQSQGIDVTLMQGHKSQNERLALEAKLNRHKALNVVWFKSKPTYKFEERKVVRKVFKKLISIPNYKNAVVHVRGEHMGYILKQVLIKYGLSIPVLIDIRAVVYEELKYKVLNKSGVRKVLSKIQEKYYEYFYLRLFSSDLLPIVITSVSPLINEYISKHYPECRYKMVCHPNIAGSQFVFTPEGRDEIRKKYGFSDNDIVVICASNGGSIWQKDTQVISYMLKKGYKVINLSPKAFDMDGCVTTLISFSDMPKYLSAADVAILWRDDTFMNNSASPSKFSEFASMGLYVVHNASVAVATKFITENHAGVLCKEPMDIPIDEDAVMTQRKERYDVGQRAFAVSDLGQSYINTYRNMKSNQTELSR